MTEHNCTIGDLVFGSRPIEDPGDCVSFPATCRICGKVYEEVYSKNDGFWDPDKEEYVELPV